MINLRVISGVTLFLAVVFSWLWVFTLFNRLYIYFRRDHYRVESFEVVDRISVSSRRSFESRGLTGTVAGHTERLRPELPPGFKNDKAADVLILYPRGSTVPVLYDPDAPEILIQGEVLRVLHYTPHFWDKENRLRNKLLCFVLLPIPLAYAFYRSVRRKPFPARHGA